MNPKVKLFIFGTVISLFCRCSLTPDPNYPSKNLGVKTEAPWETKIYSVSEMEALFPGTNYSGLQSVYVSTSGSDGSGDGSISNPYRTVKYAVSAKGTPGTIIRIKAGTYQESTVNIYAYASKNNPLVLYSDDGPGQAVIDGQNVTENLIVISGQYIVIDGLEIKNCTGYGIGVFPVTDEYNPEKDSFTVIRNDIVHHTGRDAVKSAHINFILIENNDISQVQHLQQYDDCIDGVAVYHSICRNNYLHDNGPGTGGYFKGGSANNIWYNNLIVNCGDSADRETYGAGLNIGGWGQFSWRDNAYYEYPSAYEQLVFNNVFINCAMAGITIGSAQNSQIYNNSFFNCGYNSSHLTSGTIIRIPEPDNVASGNIQIFNNLAFNDASHPFKQFFKDFAVNKKTGTISHGYNTIYSEGAVIGWNYPDPNDITETITNPMFADPLSNNLKPLPGSPAIDSGKTLSNILIDYESTNRPLGAAYDRGAYEQ
ncbi:MAG: hypothetical protein A2Y33_13895 [Spirochaetes bacterium GWF1_51_8]|nr:MAG: hypothetical protein A2Y33_13895 [Spirochaetes bacterium GWF1_51_8]